MKSWNKYDCNQESARSQIMFNGWEDEGKLQAIQMTFNKKANYFYAQLGDDIKTSYKKTQDSNDRKIFFRPDTMSEESWVIRFKTDWMRIPHRELRRVARRSCW